MPNNNYLRGRAIEYKIMQELEAEGYKCTRASGSHSAFDVIAYNNLVVRFIQAKKTKTKHTFFATLKELDLIEVPDNCTKELWVWVEREGFKKHIVPKTRDKWV